VVRFTSLFGALCDGFGPASSIGAPEPFEKARDGESGPKLDRGLLPCCDKGRIDSRLSHESREDTESRAFSTIGRVVTSPCRIKECLLSLSLGDDTCMLDRVRDEFGG